jgi:hypothetical protein
MHKYEQTEEREIKVLLAVEHGLILSWQPNPEGMDGGTKIG